MSVCPAFAGHKVTVREVSAERVVSTKGVVSVKRVLSAIHVISLEVGATEVEGEGNHSNDISGEHVCGWQVWGRPVQKLETQTVATMPYTYILYFGKEITCH